MELRSHAPRWAAVSQRTDWAAAAVAGFVAGAVLMLLELVWAATTGTAGPWRISALVAALVMGPGVLQDAGPSFGVLAVALLTHYALGIVFGLVFGVLVARLHYERSAAMMQVLGALFGAALYFVDFHLLSQLFPWFVELRGWATFIAHLVFGMTASMLYWKLARRR